MSCVVILSITGFSFRGHDLCLDVTEIYTAGVIDEAEDAYSSGTPGLILLNVFKSFRVNLLLFIFCPLFNRFLSSDYDFVDALVFFVFLLPCRCFSNFKN